MKKTIFALSMAVTLAASGIAFAAPEAADSADGESASGESADGE